MFQKNIKSRKIAIFCCEKIAHTVKTKTNNNGQTKKNKSKIIYYIYNQKVIDTKNNKRNQKSMIFFDRWLF